MGFDFGGSSGGTGRGGTSPKPPKPPKPLKAPQRSSFGNMPTQSGGSSYKPGSFSGGGLRAPRQPITSHLPRASFSMPSISWSVVLGVLVGLVAIALLWVNRDAITAFLTEVFMWTTIIVVSLFLLRYVVFGRFTRRR